MPRHQRRIRIGSPAIRGATAGIVSAKHRETGSDIAFLQTDVAVNPGNSGGPLINTRGEVVGVNSQILSPIGSYIGISFAIPIDEAMRVVDQLKSGGRGVRGAPRAATSVSSRPTCRANSPKSTGSRPARTGLGAHSFDSSFPARPATRPASSPVT